MYKIYIMKNFFKKNWFWILLILIILFGGYFAFNNNEGMTLERLCYTRESDGARICVKGETSCTYFSDGSSKCTQGKNICNQFTSCASCTDKNAKPLGGRCYWNNSKNTCSSKLEEGSLPYCMNPNMNQKIGIAPAYLPVITLLPTTAFSNASPINSY